jgi:hypothetical protein
MEVRKLFDPTLLFEASSNDVRKPRFAIERDMVDKAELKAKYEPDP